MPAVVSSENVTSAIKYLVDLQICCGNGDAEFLELRQSKKDLFLDKDGEKSNFMDKWVCFKSKSDSPGRGTIRHVKCARLVKLD